MDSENFNWSEASVLVTGGTGSFGKQFVATMLQEYHPRRLAVLSRDELKQSEMASQFPAGGDSPMRYFLGDVRDADRLRRAFDGVDVVVHAAAMKQVPAAESDPFEAVLTNIIGTKNVIDAAIDCGVKRVFTLSTDKAVNPVNLYGATKLVAEKLTIQANTYGQAKGCSFACCRYGNVVGSRGSVVPLFKKQRSNGKITLTDERMTRFWITLDQGVRFVIHCIEQMNGGEVFVPKIPAMKMSDLAEALAPGVEQVEIGIRPGEKLHEALISADESRLVKEFDNHYVLYPAYQSWSEENISAAGSPVDDRFRYQSDTSDWGLSQDELLEMTEDE
jgi:UDP-N-acetylglucosamine 4,6-dehydratase/5-epimerase